MPARQPLNNGLKAPACTPERTPTIPEYASTGSPKSERRTLDSRPLDSNASHSTSWDQNVDLTGLRISSARVVASRNQESVKKAVGIASPQSRVADMRSCLDSSGNKSKTNRFATSVSASASTSQKGSQATRLVASPLVLPIQSNTAGMENSTNAAIMRDSTTDSPPWPPSLLYHSEQTLATFYMHNAPFLSPLSPHYLSQPETPSVRDFEETWVLESVDSQDGNLDNAIGGSPSPSGDDRLLQMPKLPGSCLSVYYLSQGDHTSASTLQKMPPAQDLALPESDPKDLVQSWNDGSFQQDETRGGYPLTDLGYLSKAIT
ncbi:MAG: hypothetical protein LQ352_002024 [Teloschistes flavicans]|nr:MAG: hypothetical protein LQ352_002024 [Teloschistes flavicans]